MGDLTHTHSVKALERTADIGMSLVLLVLSISLVGALAHPYLLGPWLFVCLVWGVRALIWVRRPYTLTSAGADNPHALLEQSHRQPRYTVASVREGAMVYVRLLDKTVAIEEQCFQGASSETVIEACEYQATLAARAEELNQVARNELLEQIGAAESEKAARRDLETDAIHLQHMLQEAQQGYQH